MRDKPFILVTGAESTGTRLMSRLLRQAGAKTMHAVMPFATPSTVVWHTRLQRNADGAVVMFRDLRSTIQSQVRVGHAPTEQQALEHVRRAYVEIFEQLACPWFPVTFESLERPEAIMDVCKALGLPGVPDEEWRDENAKYYE